jgi:hypothetical protein
VGAQQHDLDGKHEILGAAPVAKKQQEEKEANPQVESEQGGAE